MKLLVPCGGGFVPFGVRAVLNTVVTWHVNQKSAYDWHYIAYNHRTIPFK